MRINIQTAIIIELINTGLLVLLVIIPLYKNLQKTDKTRQKFIIAFYARLVLLAIFDFLLTPRIVIVDTFIVYLGLTVTRPLRLAPILEPINDLENDKLTFEDLREVTEEKLQSKNIKEGLLIKKELINKYKLLHESIRNKNESLIEEICDYNLYQIYRNNMNYIRINSIKDTKIIKAYFENYYQVIELLIKLDVLDEEENITKEMILKLDFTKKIEKVKLKNKIKCVSCATEFLEAEKCPKCNKKTGVIVPKEPVWKIRNIGEY